MLLTANGNTLAGDRQQPDSCRCVHGKAAQLSTSQHTLYLLDRRGENNGALTAGTLMNLCDNPNKVSVGEAWQENDVTRRTPIIVTGRQQCIHWQRVQTSMQQSKGSSRGGRRWKQGVLHIPCRPQLLYAGNDFSKMFAPLIRDGRMDKFHWKPSRDDLINIL
jgi:hypothetical protein